MKLITLSLFIGTCHGLDYLNESQNEINNQLSSFRSNGIFKSSYYQILLNRDLAEVDVCLNNFTFGMFYEKDDHSCSSFRNDENLRVTLCQLQSVRDSCPLSCGLCCEDNNIEFKDEDKKNRNCIWLSTDENRKTQYCAKYWIRNICPNTCDYCPEAVSNCINNDSYTVEFNSKTLTCKEMVRNEWRRKKLCLREEVRLNCPHSCGICCIDDALYTYAILWKGDVGCDWISKGRNGEKNKRANYCKRKNDDGIMLRDKCPYACNYCFPEVTLAPTMPPSDEPSPAPFVSNRRNLAEQININEIKGQKDVLQLLRNNFDITSSLELILSVDIENAVDATDHFYADLPAFVTQDSSDPFKCQCVDCEEDSVCGGLWKAKKYENTDNVNLKTRLIHIVVSHCKSPLNWLEEFVKGFDVESIHVITKCGEDESQIGAPSMATIVVQPNIGRCDHTYAYYIANILPNLVDNDRENGSIVVFLKDDISMNNLHQSGEWNTFEGLVRIASSDNGFACGILPDHVKFGQHQFLISAYHELETLLEFSMKEYNRNRKGYAVDVNEFLSVNYNTMGDWWHALSLTVPNKLVQVCYGGVFAASVSNIIHHDISTWQAIEQSLSRGNNIIEGHLAERSWGSLLATPLQPYQIDALLYKSDGVYLNKNSVHGALMARSKLFLHAGIQGTSSTEILTKYLIEYKSIMKLDGYNIAVHDKFDDGAHGFPNIDRLASCMWSDMIKTTFNDYEKDVTSCPENLLSELTDYMRRSESESHDLVILNPWLTQVGTAESLGIFIDPIWDITTVIYYRRYFEWITIMFEHFRKEFLQGQLYQEISVTAFRYIDFIRKHNKRLFDDVNAGEYTIRKLLNTDDDIKVKKSKASRATERFNSDYDIKELTDLQEYTYFVAKQYNSVPRLRKVEIVNFHDIRGPEVNFFCHVLVNAHNSCKAVVNKKDTSNVSMRKNALVRKMNKISSIELETVVEDIVIAAISSGKLVINGHGSLSLKIKSEQIQLWVEMVRFALIERNVTVEDLPFECLRDFETNRLLQVSIEYEQSMLPVFSASSKGESSLRNTFSKWRFCSVDTNEIIHDQRWNYLFEKAI